ncbi:four helix bundle protein [Longimicrobium sp.]|uniref:four helix bundle protein n=1 Tax=Longimicrobium sp. TaxID=2029185 RepID=UPI002ED98452
MVWQKAMDMVVQVYRLSDRFPKSELYRLTSQLTRAAASVPANLAEGNGRSTRREYAHFVSIARGSLNETETFLLLAIRLGYITEEQTGATLSLVTEIGRMLTRLHARLSS